MTVDELREARGLAPTLSDATLARLEGVSRQAVHKWRKRGWVPHERAEAVTPETKTDAEENAEHNHS